MHRLAVKDAMRAWWRETRGLPMPHPAELLVMQESDERSRVRLDGETLPGLVATWSDRREAFACVAEDGHVDDARRALDRARAQPRPEENLDDLRPV